MQWFKFKPHVHRLSRDAVLIFSSVLQFNTYQYDSEFLYHAKLFTAQWRTKSSLCGPHQGSCLDVGGMILSLL